MSPIESENIGFELPLISPKTSSQRLLEYSKSNWGSDARNRVASDIVKNGKELMVGHNIDWDLVLRSIRYMQYHALRTEQPAISAYGAARIGGLGAIGNWAMHAQQIVYLSANLIADMVKDSKEFVEFKSTVRKLSEEYASKTLPQAGLYMDILDYLLEIKRNSNYQHMMRRLQPNLQIDDVEGVYDIIIKSRDDFVRRRG